MIGDIDPVTYTRFDLLWRVALGQVQKFVCEFLNWIDHHAASCNARLRLISCWQLVDSLSRRKSAISLTYSDCENSLIFPHWSRERHGFPCHSADSSSCGSLVLSCMLVQRPTRACAACRYELYQAGMRP